MFSKLQLNEAIRVGPWRVARKHLLFILLFCFVIVIFGIVVLETHVFESADEENDEDEDEGDEDGSEFGKGVSGGDWVMVAIMSSAGIIALLTAVACFMAKTGAPEHLGATTRENQSSVYTVQYDGDSKSSSISAVPRASYSAPQPIWNGQMMANPVQIHKQQPQVYPIQLPPSQIQQPYPHMQPSHQQDGQHAQQQQNQRHTQQQQIPQTNPREKPSSEQPRQPQPLQIRIQPQLSMQQQTQQLGMQQQLNAGGGSQPAMKQPIHSNPTAPPHPQPEKPPPYSP